MNPTHVFWRDLIALHKEMLRANTTVATEHPAASPWWSWPLMLGPMSYWTSGDQWLMLRGNPAVWWGSALGVVAVAARSFRKPDPRYVWMGLLFVGSWLPLACVDRALFLYHYFTPLTAAVAITVLGLDELPKKRALVAGVAVALIACGFAFGFTRTYGM